MHSRHGDPRHVGPRAVKGALVPARRLLAQSHHAALARTPVDVVPGARVQRRPLRVGRSVGPASAAQGGQCRVEPPACLDVSISVVALTLSNIVSPAKHGFLSMDPQNSGRRSGLCRCAPRGAHADGRQVVHPGAAPSITERIAEQQPPAGHHPRRHVLPLRHVRPRIIVNP